MKRLIYLPLICLLFLGNSAFQQNKNADEPKRIALIVAIADFKNEYPANEQWGHLSSLNDDTIITDALIKQGFTDIMHLQNSKATIQGIRDAFAGLKKKINPGDIVYIHFSCHGQQIWDDNGDETDGLDECIVCYDAPMRYHKGYTGSKHLRDDELGSMVKEIRQAAGADGNVLVVSDACHSGTTLRGPVCRGTEPPMVPDGFDPLKVNQSLDGSIEEFTEDKSTMAPVVVFSACQAKETNQEYNHKYGSLSFAITKALTQLKTGDNYNTFFAYVNASMASMQLGQTPMVEGAVKTGVFGGSAIKQSNYYTIKFIKTGILVVQGGTLNGLYNGSKVAVMPAGSAGFDASKVVVTGTVTSADMSRAWVSIDKDLSNYQPGQLWVFVTEQAFGTEKLKVGCGDNLGKNKNEIKKNIQLLQFVEWNEKTPDVRVNTENGKYYLELFDGRRPFEAVDNYEALNKQLNSYMQGKIMSEASFEDPDLKVELDFIPAHFDGWDGRDPIITQVPMSSRLFNGALELIDDDVFSIKLKNSGHYDVYVNILEIAPNGSVNVILPDFENEDEPADYFLPVGKEQIVPGLYRKLSGPEYGKYIYKVFATREKVSFRAIYNSRGAATDQKYVHPAEKLFGQSFSSTRGGESLKASQTSGGGTTTQYSLLLKKK